MSATCWEVIKSGQTSKGESRAHEKVYFVNDTNDHDTAVSAVLALAPVSVDIFLRGTYSVDPVSHNQWVGTVSYVTNDGNKPDNEGDTDTGVTENTIEFDIGGESERMYKALETVGSGKSGGGDAVDMEGAINAVYENGRHTVEGIDVMRRVSRFTLTQYVGVDALPSDFSDTIEALAFTVNDDTVSFTAKGQSKSYEAGSLRFDGGQLAWLPDKGYWRLTRVFSHKPNYVVDGGATMDDGLGTIYVDGWDHIWYRTTVLDSTTGRLRLKFSEYWINRVYERTDFADLFIAAT